MGNMSAAIDLQNQATNIRYSVENSVSFGIASIQDLYQAISIPIDTASIDRTRDSIDQTTTAVQRLDDAIMGMNPPGASISVMQHSGNMGVLTANHTERFELEAQNESSSLNSIRESADEQARLNQEIQAGAEHANAMADRLKHVVKEYLTLENIEKVLSISDDITKTTARLDLMNDGQQSTQELRNMIYDAAQESRGSAPGMTDAVIEMGNNSGGVFGSSEEIVAFAGLMQKEMSIAGAGTQEASEAMQQLAQAFGSGVMCGEELNGILAQAPNFIQTISEYLGLPTEKIREMASAGQLSASDVKAAVFASADEINAKFQEMPMTWEQICQSMGNASLMAFQPVLQGLNGMINSEGFQALVSNAMAAMATLGNFILTIFNLAMTVGSFIASNWSVISPVIYGIATALAIFYGWQILCALAYGMIAAAQALMSVGPVMLIIFAIITLISIILTVCNAIAEMTGVANSGFGMIAGGINVVLQFFKNLGLSIANLVLGISAALAALAFNMRAAFHNAICSVQAKFYNLLSTALEVIAKICEKLNHLPFVNIDYSGIQEAANNYAAKAQAAEQNKKGYISIMGVFNTGNSTFDTFEDDWASKAWQKGTSWGDGVAESLGNFGNNGSIGGSGAASPLGGHVPGDPGAGTGIGGSEPTGGYGGTDIGGNELPGGYGGTGGGVGSYGGGMGNLGTIGGGVEDIAGNTAAMADTMDITGEELKYLRDIAEQEAVNRFTTAEITIEQVNHNNISREMDLDGVILGMTEAVNEAIDISTEGVHK